MSGQTPEKWFILVYRLADQKVEVKPFDDRLSEATEQYAVLESEHRGDPTTEVVLVGADSLDTIKRTHSHYFVEREREDVFAELVRLGVS